MVYESDFYTTRRPYSSRITPTISSYSVSIPSQVTKYLPGIGKVYVVNTLPRYVVPYPGHRPITYTTYTPTQIIRLRPSSYIRELDRIEHKYRPPITYSYLDEYLNSPSATRYLTQTFDDEKRAIQAKSNQILQAIHTRVPRMPTIRVVPLSTYSRYEDSDAYLRSITRPVRNVARDILNISYYSEPVKQFLGPGHLACIRFAGDKAYSKRKHLSDITDHVIRNDINLLSYYLKNREAAQAGSIPKPIQVIGLDPLRPTRIFGPIKPLPDPSEEKKELAELKAANRAARALEQPQEDTSAKLREKRRKQEEEKAAEAERALAEERARQKEKAKKEEEARRAELQKQAELEKQRLLEEEAEREAQRIEKARKEAAARLAEEERLAAEKKAEEERLAAEKKAEEERLAAEKKAEEERLAAEKKAEEERLAAEKKAEEERLAAEKKAEEERIAAEKKAEEERKAEEARLEEERRQAEEAAREAKELEEVELQRQAEELAEIARRAEEELANKPATEESAKPEETETAEQAADQPAEPASPPAVAEDVGTGDAESADEQADIPNEEVSADVPATPEPIVEEPQTPEVKPAEESEAPAEIEEVHEE